MRRLLWMLVAFAVGCGGESPRPDTVPTVTSPPAIEIGEAIPASPQRAGDPKRGWDALVGEGYVGCGVPRSLWDRFGGMGGGYRIQRSRGADLPYFMNAVKQPSGVEVVTANCLGCHAAWLRGKLVIGLGEVSQDYSLDVTAPLVAAALMVSDAERPELVKLAQRMRALAGIKPRTIGANPADHIAGVLFAHRDPKTLAWSDTPIIPIPDEPTIPIDVPAWWLLGKKTAMFHTGAGRGDQARIMMTASVLCVDDVATARAIDSYFPDIRAYVLSLEPPKFPDPIDGPLAASGKQTFEVKCSKCHGTYGPGGRYQSRIIAIDKIGTDPMLARKAAQFAGPMTTWFNSSFFGELAKLEPGPGYVPPPLDGVWATAPYLHNGSIPNLAALLDSSKRLPRAQIVRGGSHYDLALVGWPNKPAAADTDEKWVYDTSLPGYASSGHTFGDKLTDAQRAAVIEYLKTL